MTTDLFVFFGLALVAVAAGLGMLFSASAIYSALYLILNFSVVAVLYLILEAPFIALTQITVYAGAIMVLFLFVIMLLGAERTGRAPAAWWLQPLALFLGAVMLVELVVIIITHRLTFPAMAAIDQVFGSPSAVAEMLFNQYVLPFEVISILLLAAMVGAIVLSKSKS